MMHRAKKDNGPGVIVVDGSVLTYAVNMVELNPDLIVGDTILVWADTHYKGIQDRAPDTNDSDGCGKPEVAGEFIELELAPPTGCAAGDRYEDQGDGTVLDCNTNLVWLKDASCAALPGTDAEGRANWFDADAAAALADSTCGLTDGSQEGDWRLPTASEFCSAWVGGEFICPPYAAPDSLVNTNFSYPTVSNTEGTDQWTEGDPFVGVVLDNYWSGTHSFGGPKAWHVNLNQGPVFDTWDWLSLYVWPVRDGQ